MKRHVSRFAFGAVLISSLSLSTVLAQAPSSSVPGLPSPGSRSDNVNDLEHDFFAAIRTGDTRKFMSYLSSGGVNVGPKAEHRSWEEVNEQMNQQRGLYCKLFDSSCLQSEIRLDNSEARECSYREMLVQNKKVRTAASEATRNGVRQAFLVAEVKNDKCSGVGLVDFIFNHDADGWKLFSIP